MLTGIRVGWAAFFFYWAYYTFVVAPAHGAMYVLICVFALFSVAISGGGIFAGPLASPSYVAYSRKRALVRAHTDREWRALCEAYGRKCLCCGHSGTRHNPITRDHVIPVRWGGSDEIGNIQPLCKSCNSRKKDKTVDYR